MPSGQTFKRVEMAVRTDASVQINVFTQPGNFAPQVWEIKANPSLWPGLEDSCVVAVGQTFWDAMVAVAPEPPEEEV